MSALHVLVVLVAVQVVHGSNWGYSGAKAPAYWASLGYPICAGTQQSPINIETSKDEQRSLDRFTFTGYDSAPTSYTLANNGHNLGVTVDGSMSITAGGLTGTKLVHSFHFHWGSDKFKGSEHTLNGEMFPMELHIVHYDSSYGNFSSASTQPKGLAVLGFFFEIHSADNPAYTPIINLVSSVVNEGTSTNLAPFKLEGLLPLPTNNLTDFYRYDGSLTTPGCYESVDWTVFDAKIKISESQLATIRTMKFADGTFLVNNFRPVQLLGARKVYSSFDSSAGVTQPHVLLIATLSAAILFFHKNC